MSIPCPLCPNFNVESPTDQPPTGDLVKPGEKARASIIYFSNGDGSPLLVHIKCRKDYTRIKYTTLMNLVVNNHFIF